MEKDTRDQSLFDLSFDENVKQSLKGAAVWAGIAAIVSITGSVLGLINYFVQKSKFDAMSRQYESLGLRQSQAGSNFISAFISFGIGIVLFVLLYKFSRKAKAGVDGNEPFLINEGLGSLSTYFKVIGILLIIVIVFALLAVLIALGQGFE